MAECLQWHRFQENDPCHIWLHDVLLEIARYLLANAELPMAPLSFNALGTGRGVVGLAAS